MNVEEFSVAEWLDYLENLHLEDIQLGLERISQVARANELLQWTPTIITVAGTNGKGSTVSALEEIYTKGGYQVASYTSPHLLVFNERIRINKKPISDEDLRRAFLAIWRRQAGIPLTYFEVTTLAALWHFKHLKLDLIILEVGLGGRLDATNIIDPDLAIITTIDLDHQEYLGDNVEAIGFEKAGILRENKPFIYGDFKPPASITLQAKKLNSTMYCLGENYSYRLSEDKLEVIDPIGQCMVFPKPTIHPKAIATAVMASICLQPKLPISYNSLTDAISLVQIVGRQQVVAGPITHIFDVAHNPQAVSLLADFIKQYQPKDKVHAVFSGLKDKDLSGLIKPMLTYVDDWYLAVLSGKRASSEALLMTVFQSLGCMVDTCFTDPVAAYDAASLRAKEGDIIIVYGSFLTVGAVMSSRILWEVLQ